MRHLGTVFAAAVVGPLAWILLAIGQDRSTQMFVSVQNDAAVDPHDFVPPVVVLAAAGLLLGLIATLRFSPLGAVLAGMAYAASYLSLLIDPTRTVHVLDQRLTVAGQHINLATPVQTGTTLLLGSLLLVGVLSAHRWRRWPRAEEAPAFPTEQFSVPARLDPPIVEPAAPRTGGSEWLDSLRNARPDAPWQPQPGRSAGMR